MIEVIVEFESTVTFEDIASIEQQFNQVLMGRAQNWTINFLQNEVPTIVVVITGQRKAADFLVVFLRDNKEGSKCEVQELCRITQISIQEEHDQTLHVVWPLLSHGQQRSLQARLFVILCLLKLANFHGTR